MNPDEDYIVTEEDLAHLGEKLAHLSSPKPPSRLVSRTLARISAQCKPIKRVFWMLRPITNPLARIVAAATIIYALAPMTDLDWADPLGARIEQHLGRHTTDNIEGFVDNMLINHTTTGNYTQSELDAFVGIQRPLFKASLRPNLQHSNHSGV